MAKPRPKPPKSGDFIADPGAKPSPAMQRVLLNLFHGREPWGHLRGRSMYGGSEQTHKAMKARGWVTWPDTALTETGAKVAAAVAGLDRLDDRTLDRLIQAHPSLPMVEVLRAERARRLDGRNL